MLMPVGLSREKVGKKAWREGRQRCREVGKKEGGKGEK
jgi:hypothetical protein